MTVTRAVHEATLSLRVRPHGVRGAPRARIDAITTRTYYHIADERRVHWLLADGAVVPPAWLPTSSAPPCHSRAQASLAAAKARTCNPSGPFFRLFVVQNERNCTEIEALILRGTLGAVRGHSIAPV